MKNKNTGKNKLLMVLEELESRDLSYFFYSLTINYDNIVSDYHSKKLDINNIRDILEKNDVKSYNLTIRNFSYDEYDFNQNRHKGYYHDADLTFHSGGIIFNFISPYLSNRQIELPDIDTLFEVYDEHIKSSNRLYNVIKKI